MGGMMHLMFKRKQLTPEQESEICLKCQFCCRWIGYHVPLKSNNPEYYTFIKAWGIPTSLIGDVVHFFVPLPCQHISRDEGCRVYKDRPIVCQKFKGGDSSPEIRPYCGWYEPVSDEERFEAIKGPIEWSVQMVPGTQPPPS